jgi:glutathione S-transferase
VPHTLITIPFSHFCEKARWALDAAGVGYREEGHSPVLHRRAVRRAGGRGSVPVLVLEGGRVLDDSPLIVRFADAAAPPGRRLLPPEGSRRDEALTLERHFDVDFAPDVRRFVYFHVLGHREVALTQFRRGVPAREARLATVFYPLMRLFMKRFMNVTERATLASRDRMRQVFDEVSRRLADGRPFLLGDGFGVADITFAALAAPMVVPPEHPRFRVAPATVPAALAAEHRDLSASPAAEFVRRLYREKRAPVAQVRSASGAEG